MPLHGPGRATERVSGHLGPRVCLSGHHLVSHQAEAPVCLCFWYELRNAFAVVACFNACGILFQLSDTLCEKKFFLTSSLLARYNNPIPTQFIVPRRLFKNWEWDQCCRIRDVCLGSEFFRPESRVKKVPDPGSGTKNQIQKLLLSSWKYYPRYPDFFHARSWIQGSKKASNSWADPQHCLTQWTAWDDTFLNVEVNRSCSLGVCIRNVNPWSCDLLSSWSRQKRSSVGFCWAGPNQGFFVTLISKIYSYIVHVIFKSWNVQFLPLLRFFSGSTNPTLLLI